MTPPAQARTFAGMWGGLLLLLAALWVRSPFLGSGAMFLAWSLPAAALVVGTRLWLDRREVRQVPRGPVILTALVLVWGATAFVVLASTGPELALDGLILRNGPRYALGTALKWLPVAFGVALSVAGLAAALEARYRILHGDAGEDPSR